MIISAGWVNSAAVKNDGTLWVWGGNEYGQLGDGTYDAKNLPVQVRGSDKWKAVSVGWRHTVAIRDDNTLWAWGDNWFGQLGNGGSGPAGTKLTPTQLSTANGPDNIQYKDYKWKAVSAGECHTVAIREDNTLWAWGWNGRGELGDGSTTNRSTPVQLSAADGPDNIPYKDYKWKTVSAGEWHTVAIREDNTLWVWGDNEFGQLGDGSTTRSLAPGQLSAANGPDGKPYKDYKWKAVSAGYRYTVAIREDNTLWAWGDNREGELGNGTKNKHVHPVKIGTGNDWKAVSAGDVHTVAIREDNSLWAWGVNIYGQLGDNTIRRSIIPNRTGRDKWKAVFAAERYTIAIKDNGILYAWGDNEFGQLGDGSTEHRATPTKVIHGE